MKRPTIEEALQKRIPLPWKLSTCDGPPTWKVERQRPENLTAVTYNKLREHGLKDAEIRELFYVMPAVWAKTKNELGIVTPQGVAPKVPDAVIEKIEVTGSRLSRVAPSQLPRIAVEDADGLNYQDRHNLGIHAPTKEEVEDVFRPEAKASALDLSGWESFEANRTLVKPRSLIVGTRKLYIGVDVQFVAGWSRCTVKIKPDGTQIALIKTASGTGFKIGIDCKRPTITCKAVSEKLGAMGCHGAEYRPVIEKEDLVVFEKGRKA